MKFSLLAKWFCAVAEAYNRGEAPWAYVDGRSQTVLAWNRLGDEGFVTWVQEQGITLKKRKK